MVDETTQPRGDGAIDEGKLFETLCELEPEAQAQRLKALESHDPAMAARLRRLLAIDEAYGTHTARSVLATELPDPVGDISDIGAFRLVRQIGRGGMGVVYLAERRSGFEQQVAIKIMPRFATDTPGRERFAQERRILAQLRHPNICSILDGGELPDGTPWLAMEYVPGEPLCAWCERRGAGLRERIALFLQLCDAVQAAHRNLVIHRDLKDNNVLVDEAGHLKLLDFGIAKSLSAAAVADGHTAAHDRFFSPMTAAPEQLQGERITIGTDVYALGALLHQLLCGFLPFERPSRPPLELQRAILETVPPKMSDALQREVAAGRAPADAQPPQALRGELDAIVAHCLRKRASERYADVGDLARDLRAWLSGHPISISQGDRVYRTRKFLLRHRVAVAISTIAVVGVLGALAVTLWQAAALRRERDAAETARQRSEIDRDRARTVAAFLRDTFEEADPGRAETGGLLARDLLDRGKRRLDSLEGQRDVQAELALLLAESDANLGLTSESDATFRAYAPAIEALAETDPDVRLRAGKLRLSNALTLEEDSPRLDAALAALARLADTPTAQVDVARLQERLLVRRSEFNRAAQTLEDAWRRHGDALDPAASLRLRVDLGNALLNVKRNEDARRICEGIDRAALRTQTPALQIRALRLIVRELKRREDAGTALATAVEQWRQTAERLYGSDSLEAASAYLRKIDLVADAGEQDALMAKAYAIQRAKMPAMSSARAYAEFNMAAFHLEKRQRPDLAEPHLAEAVRIGRQATARNHGDVRLFERTWAETLNALGRHRFCLDQLSDPPGDPEDREDAERLSGLRLALARAALALGQPARAKAEVAAVEALWRTLGTPMPTALANSLRDLRTALQPGSEAGLKGRDRDG
jgi:serine/threonine-protein kinase